MKLKKHTCKSIREFNKIIRKYIKYFSYKLNGGRERYNKLWYVWLSVEILNPWDKSLINEGKKQLSKGYPNLSSIIKTIQDNYGWEYKNNNFKDPIFKLTGVEITNEDYYYIYTNNNGDKQYSTCVGNFKDIEYYSNK